MYKWTEIGLEPQAIRFKVLSEYLKSIGVENQFDGQPIEPDQLADTLPQLMRDYASIRVGPPFGESILRQFKKHSMEMLTLQAADCIVKQGSEWWLRSCFYHGLLHCLNVEGQSVDLDGSVLVVGAGAAARVVVGVVAKLGFRKIQMTNRFDDQAFALIKDLKRKYFDIEIEFVPQSQLVMLPGTSRILVNTTPVVESNELLADLYYFNFLKPNGLVFELSLDPVKTQLLEEAEKVGARCVSGVEIAAASDMYWVKWSFDKELDTKTYSQLLLSQLKSGVDNN